ncbi:hypothetical protein [Streptomyces spiralis]
MANTRTTTSRKPRTAARAASRPSTRPAVPDEQENDEPDVSPSEAQEIEADDGYVVAELCGEQLQVLPPGSWRQSQQRLLTTGQLDAFAEQVIHPDDIDRYFDLDPTNDEFGEFVGDAARQAGESLGNSRGPVTSSRRTRRR